MRARVPGMRTVHRARWSACVTACPLARAATAPRPCRAAAATTRAAPPNLASSHRSLPVRCAAAATDGPTSPPVVDHVAAVRAGLADPTAVLVAQTAPAVRVAIAEAVGLPPGSIAPGQLVAGLRKLGFKRVFDVAFGADLTICEEAMELLARLQAAVSGGGDGGAADRPTPGPLPLLTSCCPGWVGLVEKSYPELIPHLSTCKSPHMMLGRVIKHHLAPLDAGLGGGAGDLQVVSVMPCVRKQGEADRPWFAEGDPPRRDVDHVLTTVELAGLLQEAGIDLASLPPEPYDNPLGAQSGSGVLFGTTGGVMEAALRTVAEAVSGEPLSKLEFTAVRGLDGVREAAVTIRPRKPGVAGGLPPDRVTSGATLTLPPGVDEVTVRVAVANGLGNAKKLVKAVQAGEAHYDFVEVMACPGGCMGGGGQPRSADKDVLAKRQAALYALDAGAPTVRRSHANPVVQELYASFLDHPLSPAAEEHLHTHYVAGGVEDAAAPTAGAPRAAAAAKAPSLDAALARGALADALAARTAGRGADQATVEGSDDHHQCDFCGAAVDCREGGAK